MWWACAGGVFVDFPAGFLAYFRFRRIRARLPKAKKPRVAGSGVISPPSAEVDWLSSYELADIKPSLALVVVSHEPLSFSKPIRVRTLISL